MLRRFREDEIDIAAPEIAIDDDDPVSANGCDASEAKRSRRLSLVGQRRGYGYDPYRQISARETQRRAQIPKRFREGGKRVLDHETGWNDSLLFFARKGA